MITKHVDGESHTDLSDLCRILFRAVLTSLGALGPPG